MHALEGMTKRNYRCNGLTSTSAEDSMFINNLTQKEMSVSAYFMERYGKRYVSIGISLPKADLLVDISSARLSQAQTHEHLGPACICRSDRADKHEHANIQ